MAVDISSKNAAKLADLLAPASSACQVVPCSPQGVHSIMSTNRRIDVSSEGPVTVAQIVDKKILDESAIQEMGSEILNLIEQDGRRSLALDFSHVEYLSSAALGKLITLDRKMKGHKGRLALCNIRPEILEVFQITKLTKVFDIRKDVAEAVSSFEA